MSTILDVIKSPQVVVANCDYEECRIQSQTQPSSYRRIGGKGQHKHPHKDDKGRLVVNKTDVNEKKPPTTEASSSTTTPSSHRQKSSNKGVRRQLFPASTEASNETYPDVLYNDSEDSKTDNAFDNGADKPGAAAAGDASNCSKSGGGGGKLESGNYTLNVTDDVVPTITLKKSADQSNGTYSTERSSLLGSIGRGYEPTVKFAAKGLVAMVAVGLMLQACLLLCIGANWATPGFPAFGLAIHIIGFPMALIGIYAAYAENLTYMHVSLSITAIMLVLDVFFAMQQIIDHNWAATMLLMNFVIMASQFAVVVVTAIVIFTAQDRDIA